MLSAQDSRGTISGRVVDPSGSPVAGVAVRAVNLEANVPAGNTTSATGNVTIPYDAGSLSPGSECAGYKKYASEIQVRTNDTLEVPVQLQVGDVTQSVEVRRDAALEYRRCIHRPGHRSEAH